MIKGLLIAGLVSFSLHATNYPKVIDTTWVLASTDKEATYVDINNRPEDDALGIVRTKLVTATTSREIKLIYRNKGTEFSILPAGSLAPTEIAWYSTGHDTVSERVYYVHTEFNLFRLTLRYISSTPDTTGIKTNFFALSDREKANMWSWILEQQLQQYLSDIPKNYDPTDPIIMTLNYLR